MTNIAMVVKIVLQKFEFRWQRFDSLLNNYRDGNKKLSRQIEKKAISKIFKFVVY